MASSSAGLVTNFSVSSPDRAIMPASLLPGGAASQEVFAASECDFAEQGFSKNSQSPDLNELSNFQGFGARKIPLGSSVAKSKEIA